METNVNKVADTQVVATSMLDKMQAKLSTFKAKEEQTVNVTIKDIKPTKDSNRVMLVTDKGNMFAFKNVFAGGVPAMVTNPFKAEVALRENGEFVNVSRVKYNPEEIGKYNFVATQRLAVAL